MEAEHQLKCSVHLPSRISSATLSSEITFSTNIQLQKSYTGTLETKFVEVVVVVVEEVVADSLVDSREPSLVAEKGRMI